MKTYYAFTVKDNSSNHYPTPEEYDTWIEKAQKKGFEALVYHYEIDSYGKLHIHGTAKAKDNFYYKTLKYGNLHTRCVKIDDEHNLKRWIGYCEKDYLNPDDESQKLWKYLVLHYYMFI